MEKFPVLQNEIARLEKLYNHKPLNLDAEDRFDNLTKLAASILEVPICSITLINSDWQLFVSSIGTDKTWKQRELAFSKYCIVQEDILEVEDTTKDERFSQNPLVVNAPNLHYYIGFPLIDKEGSIIGTVCGFDVKPRKMSDVQKIAMKQITSTVTQLIELRKVESKTSAILKDNFKAILNELRKQEGDELVNEFEKIFKNRISQDIDDLIRARKSRDFEKIQIKAHYLSTTLLTLKFSHGLALSGELEKAVDNNQDASTLMLTDRFIDYLNGALNEL